MGMTNFISEASGYSVLGTTGDIENAVCERTVVMAMIYIGK